jgi:hypothetical protein
MTVRPDIEFPRDPAGDAVVHAVAAARRRLRTIGIVRGAALTAPGGAALGAALSLAGWAPVWIPAALGGLGVAGATVWAVVHTPSIPTVARILDAHLELRDRVSAALQLRETGGPIAALVARDAALRLARVNLTALFPLTIGRAPTVTTAVAVALAAWLALGGAATHPPAGTAESAGIDAQDGNGGETPARAGRAARASNAATSGRADQRRDIDARQPANRATDAVDAPRAATGTPSSQAPAAAAQPTQNIQGQPANSTQGHQQAASATASRATTARGGAAAGRLATGPVSGGAGGASGQGLAPASGGNAAPPLVTPDSGVAGAQAEAAVARDIVPPDYREHVRSYFRAIGAERTPGGSR